MDKKIEVPIIGKIVDDEKLGNKVVFKRTLKQNSALHLYFQLLADQLNEAGLDMRVVLKPEVSIPWGKDTIKDFLWRPIQRFQLGKKSTTELTTAEIDKVFEVLNRHLSEKFPEIEHIPFPNEDAVEIIYPEREVGGIPF